MLCYLHIQLKKPSDKIWLFLYLRPIIQYCNPSTSESTRDHQAEGLLNKGQGSPDQPEDRSSSHDREAQTLTEVNPLPRGETHTEAM